MSQEKVIDWENRGKSVAQLIKELQSFEDQNLEVKISIDDGDNFKPISLVGRFNTGAHAGLIYCTTAEA